jgi:hypothetical protein
VIGTRRLLYEPLPALPAVVLFVALVALGLVTFNVVRYPRFNVPAARPPVIATVGPSAAAGSILTTGWIRDPHAMPGIGGGAGGCLAPVQRGSASLEICWQAYRLLGEEDPENDHYAVEVTATAHGRQGGAITWAVVQSHALPGAKSLEGGNSAFLELGPGQCRNISTQTSSFNLGVDRVVTACEHWRTAWAIQDLVDSDVRTTWECRSCLAGVIGDRDVSLVQLVTTEAGRVPMWELGADLGV